MNIVALLLGLKSHLKRFHQEVNLPRCVFSIKEIKEIKPDSEWVNNSVGSSSSLVDTTCGSNYCKHCFIVSDLKAKAIDININY